MFDKVGVSFIDQIDILFWHICKFIRRSELITVGIKDRFLINDIDLAFELIFFAKRKQNRPRVGTEFLAHALDRHGKVGTDAIHFINECDARDFVFRCLPPDCFRLRLHARDRIENRDPTVEHTQ